MQDIKQTVIELMDAAAARGLAEFELYPHLRLPRRGFRRGAR